MGKKKDPRFAELKKKIKGLKDQIRQTSKDFFQEFSKELFKKWPTMDSFSWVQYTPHFNDGDDCYFGAEIEEPEINGDDYFDEDEEEDKVLYDAQGDVAEFLSQFDEDDLEEMFGDHAKVVVTRKGVKVQHYEHE